MSCRNTECNGTEKDFIIERRAADEICTLCGLVQKERMRVEGQDWNNYKKSDGSSQNKSRVGWTDPWNPYESYSSYVPKGLFFSITYPDGTRQLRDISRLHCQQACSSKFRAFTTIIKQFEQASNNYLNVSKKIINRAKTLWAQVAKTGEIFRGAPRKGIVACCILYACKEAGNPKTREEIAAGFNISSNDISQGEPLFRSIIQNTPYKTILDNTPSNYMNSFRKYISLLGLPYKLLNLACNIYKDCELVLEDKPSKSVIAGILTYLIKDVEKMKYPTKKKISEVVDVCNPTINKIVKIIKKHYSTT